MSDFAGYWNTAYSARGLTKFIAEVPVPDALQTSAARLGREFLLASALPLEDLDDVLSEIMLLSLNELGTPTWRLTSIGPNGVSAATGGRWTIHFAKSFFRATSVHSGFRPDRGGAEPEQSAAI